MFPVLPARHIVIDEVWFPYQPLYCLGCRTLEMDWPAHMLDWQRDRFHGGSAWRTTANRMWRLLPLFLRFLFWPGGEPSTLTNQIAPLWLLPLGHNGDIFTAVFKEERWINDVLTNWAEEGGSPGYIGRGWHGGEEEKEKEMSTQVDLHLHLMCGKVCFRNHSNMLICCSRTVCYY